jgi:DNA-binding PadR family transcriptional regulator
MTIPLYLLGLLYRHGPMHGYQLKKMIESNLSDFTRIKLSIIYYHLEKMEKEGLLTSIPEGGKTVYSISEKGKSEFQSLLKQFLEFELQLSFDSDAVFYFSGFLPAESIRESLEAYRLKLTESLQSLKGHRKESLKFLPEEAQKSARVIFSRHERHYRAELDWVKKSLISYPAEN